MRWNGSLRWLAASLALGGWATACGDEGAGTSLDDFERQNFEAYCEYGFRCGFEMLDMPLPWVVQFDGSVDRCLDISMRSGDRMDVASLEGAVDRGTVAYDAQLASDCLGYIAAAPCGSPWWGSAHPE